MVPDVTLKSHLPSIYNILLIGETGSGKSTLINYLTNYFNNGSPEEPRIAIPTKYHKATEKYQSSEKDLYDATKSKTSECATYGFKKANRHYNFIDTPGLSDTEGTERDAWYFINSRVVPFKKYFLITHSSQLFISL
ncbi:unnamed protein product [Auanema sp. JU1783]|nr:unnamed protein product [Auanema sp. JU1783]